MKKQVTLAEAISRLSEVKDVEQWNEVRDAIKATVPDREWVRQYVPAIDGSGLIVKVLGQDEK